MFSSHSLVVLPLGISEYMCLCCVYLNIFLVYDTWSERISRLLNKKNVGSVSLEAELELRGVHS